MRSVVTLLVLLAAVSGGCGISVGPGKAPDITYYHLALPAPKPATRGFDLDLAILPFSQVPALDRDGIRYRLNDVEGGYWSLDRWAEPVSSMVRVATHTELEGSGLFRRVVITESSAYAQAVLAGDVVRFGEEDRTDGWYAVVAVDYDLIVRARGEEEEDRVLLGRRYERSVRAADRSVPAVVRALSKGLSEILGDLGEDLVELLEEDE
jgi:ABC-type uncharacterized transport system auxiliary subunit